MSTRRQRLEEAVVLPVWWAAIGAGLLALVALWARNGRELFYRTSENMMAVDVAPGRVFKPSRHRQLFKTSALRRDVATDYDIFPDGQHFVMVEELNPAGSAQLHFITEWFEELKRLSPASSRR